MILNVILSAVCIFVLAFCWIAAIMKSAETAAVLALAISLAGGYLAYLANKRSQNKKYAKTQNKKLLESFSDFLAFNSDNAETFKPMLSYYGFSVERTDGDGAVVTKNGKTGYVTAAFSKSSFTKEDAQASVVSAKRNGADKLYVFCNKVGSDVKALTEEHFCVEFFDINNTYALFEQSGKLPDFPKVRIKKTYSVAKYAFNRRRFGWYFASCVFLALLSVVSYFPYYMLAWATAMFVLAMYSAFNKKYNPVPTNVSLN